MDDERRRALGEKYALDMRACAVAAGLEAVECPSPATVGTLSWVLVSAVVLRSPAVAAALAARTCDAGERPVPSAAEQREIETGRHLLRLVLVVWDEVADAEGLAHEDIVEVLSTAIDVLAADRAIAAALGK